MPEYRFQKRPPSGMFEYLRGYQFILVTGPHRAGTTIAAAMIANDLGHNFEEDAQAILESLTFYPEKFKPTVFHCPSYCHYVHHLAEIPALAVVIVIRDIDAIVASEKRIPWAFEPQQIGFYQYKTRPRPAFAVQPPISAVKYRYWQEVQKPILGKNGYEVRYEDLEGHPMWVKEENRTGFTANQIELGTPHGPRVQGRRLPVGVEGKVIKNGK